MSLRNQILATWFLFILTTYADSARILAAFPHVGKSHYFMFQPFVYKLAERGHQVHIITYFPDPKPPPNVTFIDLTSEGQALLFNSFPLDALESFTFLQQFGHLGNIVSGLLCLNQLHTMGIESCNDGLSHPHLQKLLGKKQKFDLVIVEYFNTDCFASLANFYNAPLIGIFSSVMMPWHNDRFGNPDNPAYISNHFMQHSSRMTFGERWCNAFMTYVSKIFYRFVHNPQVDNIVKKYIGDSIAPIGEVVKNTSLFLLNIHFSLFQPRPLAPGIIELGGFHVKPAGEIPHDIRKFIDESEKGVIFFSLGSTLKGSTMPKYKLETIQRVLAKVPYRILWKWEDDEMPNKPENVMIQKWVPQNDILGHPKVKLFITHSGLMGTEEAVYHGVPMLMMPILGDQPINAAACEEKGIGVIANYYTLTEKLFSEALDTALQPRYAENAKRLAKIFMDRPITTLDSAIYWTEYVLKYDGAHHIRSAAIDMPFYQEYLLDVMAATLLGLYIVYKAVKFLVCRLCCKSKSTAIKQKRS